MMFHISHTRGYTFIELLIVLSILAILVGVSVATFVDVRKKQVLKVVSEEVFGMLLEAQGDTLAARDNLKYGVYVDATKAVFFEGPIYDPISTENVVYTFVDPIRATSTPTGGLPFEVSFARLTGTPSTSGTITLYDRTGHGSSTIQIYASGLIEHD